MKIKNEKIISLKCKSNKFDKSIHNIFLEKEDDMYYYGKPVNNNKCPVLKYPKFAWMKNHDNKK